MQRMMFRCAVALTCALAGGLVAPVTVHAAAPSAMFVVSNAASPVGGDQVVATRLESLGYEVATTDDDAIGGADPLAHDVIVISTSVSSSKVTTAFTDVATPVVVWEHFLFDDLGLTSGSGKGTTNSTKTITITDPGHPVAAGLTGTPAVTAKNRKQSWGTPAPAATVIATESASPNRPVIFAYESGDSLHQGTAPGRRVAMYPTLSSPQQWTADGAALFDAAITWAAGGAVEPSNTAPTVDAGSDQTVALTGTATLAGSVDDDGRPTGNTTTTWTASDDVVFADSSSPTTTATFTAHGDHVLTLSGDDGELQASDTVTITVPDPDAPPPPEEIDVMWITASTSPTYGEQPAVERLEDAGFLVDVVADDVATTAAASGYDLVVITGSVNPSKIDDDFADLAVPLLASEHHIYDNLGFVIGGNKGQTTNTRVVDVVDSDHPIAAGRSGVISVLDTRRPLSWGAPVGEPAIVATAFDNADRATVFAFETGAAMNARSAPARRVGFFVTYSGPRQLSTNGWAMWDAAIDWLVAGPLPTGEAPVANASATPLSGTAPLDVSLDASASTDADDDIESYDWDFGDASIASGPSTSHTFAAGTHVVTLTVTDATGRTGTDTVTIVADATWAVPDRHFRTAVTVDAGAHERIDHPAVGTVDFGQLLAELGGTDTTFDPESIDVVEVDTNGNVAQQNVTFQFDPADDFDATSNATGELVILLDGTTPAGTSRRFQAYFDSAGQSAGAANAPAAVSASITADEGLTVAAIDTPRGEWNFDLGGAGFSSLIDIDGNDWISYSDAPGSAGEFRGIPNAVYPEDAFSPGASGVTTKVRSEGPARASFDAATSDGRFVARWHIYPTYAEMQMLEAADPYWFLYEGVPGGTFNAATDRVRFSDGGSQPASGSRNGDLIGEEWVFFTDQTTNRSLFVSHVDDDTAADSYRSMDNAMTVFGFGRGTNLVPRMSTPEVFRVGFLEGTEFNANAASIRSINEPPTMSVGSIDSLIAGAVPPTADVTALPTTTGEAPLSVDFSAAGSTDDGTIVSTTWDFGDGSGPVAGTTASHTYTDSGVYLATVSVADDQGLTDTAVELISVGLGPLTRVDDGLIALYDFSETSGATVADTSGVAPALDLTIDDPGRVTHLPGGGLSIDGATVITSNGPADKIAGAVTATDELTVEAWVDPANLTQNGPSRIVTISASSTQRNILIGQGRFETAGNLLETRLRTTESDDNGRPPLITPSGSFGLGLTHVVYTRDAAGLATVFIDGEAVAESATPGDLSAWDTSMQLVLANELGSSRAWLGNYHLLAFYDRALGQGDVCTNLGSGPGHGLDPTNEAPTSCFTTSETPAEAPAVIAFDASKSRDLDGTIVSYEWSFGDGTSESGTTPTTSHAYTAPGTYGVRLTTTDEDGASTSTDASVEIIAPSGGNRLRWTMLDSTDARLPVPLTGDGVAEDQQTASLIADLDGDGDNDFVIAERKPPSPGIVWYEFIDAATGWEQHVLEDELLRVEAGGDTHDVDGDGDIDVVFGQDGTGADIWYWENPSDTGDPGAAPWQRHTIKSGGDDKHHDLRFGDVDGDGTDEFVYWNQENDNKLFVAEIPTNPEAGAWPATEVFSNGAVHSEGLDIADIDLDGVDDIVGGGLWFKRASNGTYAANPVDAGYAFSRSVVGQLVEGGRPEIVIDSGDSIGALNWYEWDAGTDSWIAHQLLGVSNYGHSLRVADIDGDGHDDIFAAEMRSPFDTTNLENPNAAVRIFFGDGGGGFTLQTVATAVDNHESRIADLDDDGDLDILGKPYNIGTPNVNIWLNDGADPFGTWSRSVLADPSPWTQLFVEHADIDGDGLDDVVTGGWWFRNPGTANGTWVRSTIGAPVNNMVAVTDLDSDGDLDVIGSHWKTRDDNGNGQFSWARNDGSGNFTIFAIGDTGEGPFLQGATVAQLESGGPLELVLSWNNNPAAGTTSIVVPTDLDTNPDQAPWTQRSLSPLSENEQVVAEDIDGDGDTDLFLGSNWLRNDPGDVWTAINIFTLGTGLPDRIVLADIDGDGDADAVIGNGHDVNGELSWYERPANPENPWVQHLVANLVNPQSVDAADLDDDGDIDIVVGEHNLDALETSQLLVFENTGAGASFERHEVHVGDEHHDGAQLADFDADGDLDIVSIGFTQGRVVVYENRWR